ncbi:MAG TPA: 4,5-dihydroxyphthalate decarboxylase [Burkholderiales bacterium]
MRIPLTLALSPYDHTRDLRPRGIDLNLLELPIEEIFYRFTRFREFEGSEMSAAKTVALLAGEKPDIIALPVFVSRVFRHSSIYVAKGAGIRRPTDLEGRRVGVPEWSQTAGIYARGMLAHEYGVDLKSIDWRQAGVREPGRVEKVSLQLPQGLRVTPVPEKSLSAMIKNGELDAVISAREVPGERLFPDYRAAEAEYFRKTRIFPIMHMVVLRREVYERNRWIAMNLFQAFHAAKERSLERLREIGLSHVPLPWLPETTRAWREAMGEDFWPYGIEPNRPTLEAFLQYAYEQGVCRRHLAPEELFAPETLESFKI